MYLFSVNRDRVVHLENYQQLEWSFYPILFLNYLAITQFLFDGNAVPFFQLYGMIENIIPISIDTTGEVQKSALVVEDGGYSVSNCARIMFCSISFEG